MKYARLLLTIIFSFAFLVLFINRIIDHQTAYLKFALIDFIYKKHLASLFYFFGAIEILLAVSIFFTGKKIGRTIVDVGLILYIPFLVAYYLMLLKVSAGCIECNYTTHFLGEDIKATALGLVFLALTYIFILRDSKKNIPSKSF